ncbi:hypothetical protein NEAUS04_1761 [Nematocida ausubeli]|uniref:Uncharacterized protein n=1 Tax=Nematocida ausubeli (strain ATCC PRA-371 / ERTm2) TaxID=1913371 RepID=H8ZAA5_NEMA1|nr:uncharacterized protein NESG_00584 [Nematocida ausubeli]EHY66886.1 hypothetical protein NERG_00526 [Nematocida ausubeli]KAI5132256.1 hypothetical protein NEAUS06_0045 [Nematocida ausubeli]KAI5137076.1 hypothetical protein NEAUS07_1806 [Nematocida ausubeli]KAI5149541.1 hypothetical protein NEAUS05_1807 [Nematocida ausubeli]KAI5163688.1 hypothetical protein NEAUS04_1761 [Nematocida ausubeli]
MYYELAKDVPTDKKEIIVLGEILVEEEDIFLQGADDYKVSLSFSQEDEPMKHDLSEYEGEKVLIFGAPSKDSIKVIGHSAFKTPIDENLFRNAIKEMGKYPDLFDN